MAPKRISPINSTGKSLTHSSIALLILYFGKFPWYFPFFVHSCRYNPDIDFFIVTDNKNIGTEIPANIFIIHRTFEETIKLIDDKLQLQTGIEDAYKLCDFKPAYGVLFSDLVAGYDFWGHSDIDIVFGNIRGFITEEVLNDYDIISVRPEFISGFFALYRNSEKISNLFKQSKDYKSVFRSRNYMGLDECSLLCQPLTDGAILSELPAAIDSMTHVVKRLDEAGKLKAYFNYHVVESTPGKLRWDNGQLIYKDEYEVILFHMVSFKIHPMLQIPDWENIPSAFCINEASFSR